MPWAQLHSRVSKAICQVIFANGNFLIESVYPELSKCLLPGQFVDTGCSPLQATCHFVLLQCIVKDYYFNDSQLTLFTISKILKDEMRLSYLPVEISRDVSVCCIDMWVMIHCSSNGKTWHYQYQGHELNSHGTCTLINLQCPEYTVNRFG